MAWFEEFSALVGCNCIFFFSGINSINSVNGTHGMSVKAVGMGLYESDCRIYRDSGPLRGKESSGRAFLPIFFRISSRAASIDTELIVTGS